MSHHLSYMPTADYDAIDAVRWSRLRLLDESPAHYLAGSRPQTRSLSVGSLVHSLLLEPEVTIVAYEGRRYGKAWEEWRDSQDPAAIIAGASDLETARAVAAAVQSSPLAMEYLEGEREQVGVWTETVTVDGLAVDVACKAKLDVWHPERRRLVDLKTTRSTRSRPFGASAGRYHYHGQLAHYARAVGGIEKVSAYIVAVETVEPYDVAVFEVLPDDLRVGDALRSDLMQRLVSCERAQSWGPRCAEVQPLILPAWVYMDDAAESADYYEAEL